MNWKDISYKQYRELLHHSVNGASLEELASLLNKSPKDVQFLTKKIPYHKCKSYKYNGKVYHFRTNLFSYNFEILTKVCALFNDYGDILKDPLPDISFLITDKDGNPIKDFSVLPVSILFTFVINLLADLYEYRTYTVIKMERKLKKQQRLLTKEIYKRRNEITTSITGYLDSINADLVNASNLFKPSSN